MLRRLIVKEWSSASISWWTCALVALVFTAIVTANGTPALRHDWLILRDRADFFSSAWNTFGGWIADGIGSPRPYPTDYLLIAANSLLVLVLGTRIDVIVIVFLVGLACARAGWMIAQRLSGDGIVCSATALFFTFNPWVYSKIVAGHIVMVLACAATAMLLVTLFRSVPHQRTAALLLILTLAQLQFFVVAFVIAIVWSVRQRRFFVPLSAAIVALPIAVGIAGSQTTLLSTPYNLTWQADQSVDPIQAFILQGYFAKYALQLPVFVNIALWAGVLLCAIGAALTIRRRVGQLACGAVVIVWLFATGTKGYAAPIYAALVRNVPQSGVFRELYDLLGYLLICYAFFGAAAAAKSRWTNAPWVAISCTLVLGWLVAPPYKLWVPLEQVPRATIAAESNSRFALIPAFQPLRYERRGSGLDPDAFARASNVTPLNTSQFDYPADTALSRYMISGDDRMLAALSVSDVAIRPWLSTDRSSLKSQTTLTPNLPNFQRTTNRFIEHYRQELTFEPVPVVSGFVEDANANQVWFSDAAGLSGAGVPASWRGFNRASPITPPNTLLDPRLGWVDVRFAFAFHPELGQALGGAWTTSRAAALRVDGATRALVFVRGTLVSGQGTVITSATHGYRWVWVPAGAHTLFCRGTCVVAAQGAPPALPFTAPRSVPAAVSFTTFAPWLAVAHLPAGGKGVMRYNVRFDTHWAAFVDRTPLTHFRLAMLFNAWFVPSRTVRTDVVLVETIAFAQFILEIVGVLFTGFSLVYCVWKTS